MSEYQAVCKCGYGNHFFRKYCPVCKREVIDPRLKECLKELYGLLNKCDPVKHEWQYQTMKLAINNLEKYFPGVKNDK